MLKRIIINQVALIDRLDVAFHPGFNVLTGETGAGKSIIIDAVNLAIGERANRELIKYGAQKASVEAVFSVPCDNIKLLNILDEYGIIVEDDNELVLSRELTVSGKSVCRINGILVNLATQKAVSAQLIDIHGQHEHQSLLSSSTHLSLLDAFAGADAVPHLLAVRNTAQKIHEIDRQLNQGFISEAERERRIDILKYQIEEIEQARLEAGEEEVLQEELLKLANAEKIMLALEGAVEGLNGDSNSALISVKDAARSMSEISGLAGEYSEIYDRLNDCYYMLEDIAIALRNLRQSFDYDPARLETIERRLDLIASLKRKYGTSGITEILEFQNSGKQELETLLSGAELREKLFAERARLIAQFANDAAVLTEIRQKAAEFLKQKVEEQLHELGMEKARFSVQFIPREDSFHPDGAENAEFLLSANAGEPLKPLSRVASGGEMSRIMLALKTIIAKLDHIDTLIFDEIDTGISGHIASVVGKKMLRIADSSQVICITHLPQVAAMADAHYLVKKVMTDDMTSTTLSELTKEERYREVARIMGAEADSRYALDHAKELVDMGFKYKE